MVTKAFPSFNDVISLTCPPLITSKKFNSPSFVVLVFNPFTKNASVSYASESDDNRCGNDASSGSPGIH